MFPIGFDPKDWYHWATFVLLTVTLSLGIAWPAGALLGLYLPH